MSELVQASMLDAAVVEAARGLLVRSRSTGISRYADAVRRYVKLHLKIVDEPDELLTMPGRMIDDIERQGYTFGDCDDAAMLAGALLMGLGIRSRFKAIQINGEFGHVFAEYSANGDEWFSLDTTIEFEPEYTGEPIIVDIF